MSGTVLVYLCGLVPLYLLTQLLLPLMLPQLEFLPLLLTSAYCAVGTMHGWSVPQSRTARSASCARWTCSFPRADSLLLCHHACVCCMRRQATVLSSDNAQDRPRRGSGGARAQAMRIAHRRCSPHIDDVSWHVSFHAFQTAYIHTFDPLLSLFV